MIEIRDALADILYVVYGMGDVLGINMDVLVSDIIKSQIPITSSINELFMDKLQVRIKEKEIAGKQNLTNWNWIQIYMDLFTSRFYSSLLEYKESIENIFTIGTFKIVEKMQNIFTNIEKLCNIEDSSAISDDLLETLGENLAKLITLNYTYAYIIKIDADADFDIVHSSNMSKLCDSEEDAKATVADYESRYKNGSSPYDSPYYYELPEINKWIVKNKSTGKALKKIKYQKVVFN